MTLKSVCFSVKPTKFCFPSLKDIDNGNYSDELKDSTVDDITKECERMLKKSQEKLTDEQVNEIEKICRVQDGESNEQQGQGLSERASRLFEDIGVIVWKKKAKRYQMKGETRHSGEMETFIKDIPNINIIDLLI